MIIKSILGQIEYKAYVLNGEDYKERHPTFHPMCLYSRDTDYLVIEHSDSHHSILSPLDANKFLYLLIEATDEEKKRLIDAGYKMIGLT